MIEVPMHECPNCGYESQLTDEQLASRDSYELVATNCSELYKMIVVLT